MYARIANFVKDEKNKEVLIKISKDEIKHYHRLKEVTGKEVKPQRLKIAINSLISRIFGITFGIKLFEKGESNAIKGYK